MKSFKRYLVFVFVCILSCWSIVALSGEKNNIAGTWLFDAGQGKIAKDWSGKGNTGSIKGAKWVEGKHGKALEFSSAVGSGVLIPPSSSLNKMKEYTLACWINPYDYGQRTLGNVFWKGHHLMFRFVGPYLETSRFYLKTPALAKSRVVVPLKRWTHIATTYNESGDRKPRIYINGKEVNYIRQIASAGIASNDEKTPIELGYRKNACFNGKIDDFIIFDRSLSSAEIKELYEKGIRDMIDISDLWIEKLSPRNVFARDEKEAVVRLKIINQSNSPWQGDIAFDISGFVLKKINISLAPQKSKDVKLKFTPAMFQQGSYPVNAQLKGKKRKLSMITIAPWRNPMRYPMLSWPRKAETGWIKDMVSMGLNIVSFGSMADIEKITAFGAYGTIRFDTLAMMNSKKFFEKYKNNHICPLDKQYLDKCSNDAVELLKSYGNHPSIRAIIINSEIWGVICFCDSCRKLIKKKFNIDPEALKKAVDSGGHRRHKTKVMIPRMNAYLPKEILVKSENPLLQFAKWWWTRGGPNTGTQIFGESIHKLRPDIWTVTEPIIPFSSLQRYYPPMLVCDWLWIKDSRDCIEKTTYLRSLAKSWNCPLILTVTTFKLKGTIAPYHTSTPKDLFLMENWLCLSAFPKGLQYTQIDTMMPPEKQYRKSMQFMSIKECEKKVAGLSWKDARKKVNLKYPQLFGWQSGLPEVLRDFSTKVIKPLGPILGKTVARKADIALLHSFTARVMSSPLWYLSFQWFAVAKKIINGPYAVDVVFEDQIERKNFKLNDYKVVILPAAYVLNKNTIATLQEYINNGGMLLCDKEWLKYLKGAVAVKGLDLKSSKAVKLTDGQSLWDESKKIKLAPGETDGLWKILKKKIKPDYQSTSRDVLIREGNLPNTRIVMVVNTKLEKGPIFGKYPETLETSAPLSAKIAVKGDNKPYAYDLLKSSKVKLEKKDDYLRFKINLAPADGKIFAFYPQQVGKITIAAPGNARAGTKIKLRVSLFDSTGKAFKGCVPLSITLTSPVGKQSDFSHFDFIENGTWQFNWQLPVETLKSKDSLYGNWKATVKELASGNSNQTIVKVTKR